MTYTIKIHTTPYNQTPNLTVLSKHSQADAQAQARQHLRNQGYKPVNYTTAITANNQETWTAKPFDQQQ